MTADGADDHPAGVAARLPDCKLADAAAGAAGGGGHAVHRAVDDLFVDGVPEDVGGNPEKRANDHGGVDFVDVILVEKQFVRRGERLRRDFCGASGLRM